MSLREQVSVRPATADDRDAIWAILEPAFRAGDTYTIPADCSPAQALSYWFREPHEVFVAEAANRLVGSYFLQPNQPGAGSHVANCGYVSASGFTGRGIASAMCQHSLDYAKAKGYLAMQFNFAVSSNVRAVSLWKKFGFEAVGRLPEAFLHPQLGLVDALVMYRKL